MGFPDGSDDKESTCNARDQIANIRWITEKAREFQKTSISALLTMPKPLTVWITINCGWILGSRRSSEEGNGYPLQYSCLENP